MKQKGVVLNHTKNAVRTRALLLYRVLLAALVLINALPAPVMVAQGNGVVNPDAEQMNGRVFLPLVSQTTHAVISVQVAAADPQPIISLGQAAQYALLSQNINLHNTDIFGPVGVGYDALSRSGIMSVEAPSIVHGYPVHRDPNAQITGATTTANLQGGIVTQSLSQAFSDALAAYSAAIALTPDQTVNGNISKSTMIQATHGGQYVVRVTGNLALNSQNLLLASAPGEITKFVVIVEGTITLGGSAVIGASSNAGSQHVLFVVKGAGNDLTSKVDNVVNGTILAPFRGATFHGWSGAFIAGAKQVKFMSDAQGDWVPYVPLTPPLATPTNPPPPTAMPTNTPVPPTAIPTNTPLPPTATPTALPVTTGEKCYIGTDKPAQVSAQQTWVVDQTARTLKVRTTFAKSFVDNTYGTSAIGWPNGHKFGDLTGSDNLQLALHDASGVKKLEFKIDYISSSGNVPSGYDSLGVTGGEGKMVLGNAASVLGATTSLDVNFNQYGYVLTTNSPATNASYAPNPQYPNWIYEVWYEATVSLDAFGAAGFGYPQIASVHASPSKTGSNTEPVTEAPCSTPPTSTPTATPLNTPTPTNTPVPPTATTTVTPAKINGLGDRVFLDANGDGLQNVGESGIANVRVELLNNFGVTLNAMVTDADGLYDFDRLPLNTAYSIRFVLPAGYRFTTPNVGNDDSLDSDADQQTGMTAALYIVNGQNNYTLDAGLVLAPPAATATPTRTPVPPTAIPTNTPLLPTATPTNTPLPPTATPTNTPVPPTPTPTNTLVPPTPLPAAVGDRVWQDSNRNGLKDVGEPGVPAVTVTLLNSSGAVLASTTTDGNGAFSFLNLAAGDYIIEFAEPVGLFFTTPNVGNDDTIDSDAALDSGRTAIITLTPGQNNNTVAAGLIEESGVIGDKVWRDLNSNGRQDGNEPGIPNVTVNLLDSGGNLVAATATDEMGAYFFFDVLPGDYIVEFVKPANLFFTAKDQGTDDALDSDADQTSGRTDLILLSPGEINDTVAAGLVQTGIGGCVWNDVNQNGLRDNGELCLAGVTVKLLDQNNVLLQTTVTNPEGRYLFTLNQTGNYIIRAEAPNGQVFTQQDVGNNDDIDSDVNADSGRSAVVNVVLGQFRNNMDAGLISPTYDVATVLTLAPGQTGPFHPGDEVTFEYRVINQGAATVYDVQLIHYLPAGWSFSLFDTNGWANATYFDTVANANRPAAIVTLGDPIPVGEEITIQLRVQVDSVARAESVEHRGEVTGIANVFGAAVIDVDSAMDTNAHNDVVVDNVINNTGNDEDDHDIEVVSVAP